MALGAYVKANSQKCVELQTHLVAQIPECTNLALIRYHCRWQRLLSLAIDKLAEVECPSHVS